MIGVGIASYAELNDDFISKIPDLEIIEALSMLLEKMSRHGSYHKYFHAASLTAKLNEWVMVLEHSEDDDANFFVMNAKARNHFFC